MTAMIRRYLMIAAALLTVGCSSQKYSEMQTVEYVDLERFMGDWYVIANIPTFLEKGAYNAVERYTLDTDGTIDTVFTFNDGALDGPVKTYNPRGFIKDESNALWGMRFIWPIKADYRIVYLADDYSTTVIGRQKRDFVWIMARQSSIPEEEFQQIVSFVESIGYDVSKLQRIPHSPEQDSDDRVQ